MPDSNPSHAQKTRAGWVGSSPLRKEDQDLLTGVATFTDDVNTGNAVFAHFVRAESAHAELLHVDVAGALESDGVLAVYVARDLRDAGIGPIPTLSRAKPFAFNDRFGNPLPDPAQFPLAEDKVRYVGEPIACVVAATAANAIAGAELVEVELRELPPVTRYTQAVDPDSALIWNELAGNVSFEWDLGDKPAAASALEHSTHLVHSRAANNRVAIAFMEPRSAVASFDGERYTLTTGSQGAPGVKAQLLNILHWDDAQLRVVTPHTGGGFGARGGAYPEFVSLLFAAGKLSRTVRWTSSRSEAFASDLQSRDHEFDVQLGADADGRFKALKVQADWRHGAYVTSRSFAVMTQYLPPTLGGVYRSGPLDLRLRGLFSNTTPQAAYRGIGRVEATYLLETAVDDMARATGIDRVELRRRNLVQPDEMPWRAAGGAEFHSGDFPANLERVVAAIDWHGFPDRRRDAERRGRLRGIGVSMFIENDGGAPVEYMTLRAQTDGRLELLAGTQDFGMGHQTVFSQVIADAVGVGFDDVDVVYGDTDRIPRGSGSHGSRSARLGGGAAVKAALQWVETGKALAARYFEAAVEDVHYTSDITQFAIEGTDRSVTIGELAAFAEAEGLSFAAEAEFTTARQAHSNGAQAAEVEIDPETGHIELVAHAIVMDAGIVLNPMIVEGQMHGGLAQGLGQAWMEDVVYEASSGQLLSGSFMDYQIPRADDLPAFGVQFNEIREEDNPLGVKGAGEGPTSGAPAAFMNAVRDAVFRAGGASVEMPATPERVWRALRGERMVAR